MRQAVEEFLGSAAASSSSQLLPSSSRQPRSTPMSSQTQPNRAPLAELSATVSDRPYILKFGKYSGWKLDDVPPDYVAWLKKSETLKGKEELAKAVEEYEKVPRVYKLCFGKYKGYTLDEVPPTYLNYLHESNAAKENADLRDALAKHKHANTTSQISAQRSKTGKKKPFVVPSEYTGDHRRYYYNGDPKAGQMWIGCNDALRYFGADARAMIEAVLQPFNRRQRFWLHQVFAYAKHFGTTKNETPTKALNKFKAKSYHK